MTKNTKVVCIIESLLINHRFFVEMDGKHSRWRAQKNSLPWGLVLTPMLFNINTNDHLTFNNIRRFIYAAERLWNHREAPCRCLENHGYYRSWFLNANLGKTQVCAFHLNNHAATRKSESREKGKKINNTPHPMYLNITHNITPSFKEHVTKLRKKVSARNNLLFNLASSVWGTDHNTLKQTALALYYSTAEYCTTVWGGYSMP